ncbi:putative glycosyl transferase [Thiocapsa sp. KS1]|nr:putative glycosyl transferase [Thiocapsa sp. KS1]
MSQPVVRKNKRVVLVGPILPFRGGIAQHTTMLHRALRPRVDLLTLSYTRQYPAALFPGASDRDPGYLGHVEPGVDYVLDSLNPASWWQSARRIAAHDPDLIIIPWWTVYWAVCYRSLIAMLGSHKHSLLLLCHNVFDHEESLLKTMLARSVLRRSGRFLVHTHAEADRLKAAMPKADVVVKAHPIYDHFPASTEVLPRRARTELLFFGFVRPYKGLDLLLDALKLLSCEDLFLSIVGEFWQGLDETRRQVARLGLQHRVEIVANYVTEEQASNFFQRADCVVLPYRSATGTGVIPLAYHYNKPVIVTRVGGLPNLVSEGKTGLVVEPDSPVALADAIRHCHELGVKPEDFTAQKMAMSWGAYAQALIDGRAEEVYDDKLESCKSG